MWNTPARIVLLSTMVLACKGLVMLEVNESTENEYQLERVRRAPQSWWAWGEKDGSGTDSAVTPTAPVSAQTTSTTLTPPSITTKRSKSKSRSKKSHTTRKPSTTAQPSSVQPKETDGEPYLSEVSLHIQPTSPKPSVSILTPVLVAPSTQPALRFPFGPLISAEHKPLSAQYTEFQQKKIELFESLLDFNKFEVAYLSLQELQRTITPLLSKLATLLGNECRSEWPHLSSFSTSLQTCSHIRHAINAELSVVEEWVLRNKNFRDSIQTLSRDAKSMHQIYKDVLEKSLDDSYTDYPTFTLTDYSTNAPVRSPYRAGVEFAPVPTSVFYEKPQGVLAPFTNNNIRLKLNDRTTGAPSLAPRAAESPELGSSSVDPTDISTEQVNTTVSKRFPKSTSTENSIDVMEVSLRSFFGLSEENEGADYGTDESMSPKISKYIEEVDSEDAVSITRSFLNKALQEGLSGNPEIFFFATNLYAASPKLYDAMKNDIPFVVDTVVRKPRYRLQMNQDNGQSYAVYVNSTTGMRSVETFDKQGDQKVVGGYWKFLPRNHGDLFLLFNVETETIIGAGNGWETNGLTFKNESDIIVQPFPDPSTSDVSDNFLWELYLDCNTEAQTSATDSSEYENCPPGHVHLEIRNEQFYNLKLTLDEEGNPALRAARTSWRLEAIE